MSNGFPQQDKGNQSGCFPERAFALTHQFNGQPYAIPGVAYVGMPTYCSGVGIEGRKSTKELAWTLSSP